MTTTNAASIHKVRRRPLGGKRALGHEFQRKGRRIRRADPKRIRLGTGDASLTGVAGLAAFGRFVQRLGVDAALRKMFHGLKDGRGVVYTMEAQLRLLLDANVVGETRVFGLESLAADPLFVRLAGGSVPSVDTVYRDLARFDDMALAKLELFMAHQGVEETRSRKLELAHLDIDTTVEPLFGRQEGALPGPNPRYHGRPSYHPVLAVLAEVGCCIGGVLRHGDRGFGREDAPSVRRFVDRARAAVGASCRLVVRIDAAADCTEILQAIDDAGAHFIVKARQSADLLGAVQRTTDWRTVDRDAEGNPTRQVAEVVFHRSEWARAGLAVRVIAVRSRERDVGKQVALWEDLEDTVQVFLTNDFERDANDLASDYDGRAEVEPTIGELKNALGIGKVPSATFDANHAAFLLKLLAHNLVRRYMRAVLPRSTSMPWRLPWLRRALFVVPGRLSRSGRRWSMRLPPTSLLFAVMRQLE